MSISLSSSFGSAIDASEVSADVATQAELDNLATAYHQRISPRPMAVGSSVAVRTDLAGPNGSLVNNTAGNAIAAFYLDPADLPTMTGKSKFVKLRCLCVTSLVAPAVNFTISLSPVATWGGASNAQPFVATLGTAVGSVTFTTPAASGPALQESADLAYPAAGYHVFSITWSNTTAANSSQFFVASLSEHQA